MYKLTFYCSILGTREYESNEIGKDLSTIIKENEEKVNESNTESKENF
jgi:hypothetical protein